MIRPRPVAPTLRIALGLAALVATSAPRCADAGLVTVGTYTSGNVFPFGYTTYAGEYQQIYTPTAFAGPVSISSVAFATIAASAGQTDSVGFTVSFSTTPLANLAAPSTDYASNRGADFTQVFSGTETITSLGNGTFDFLVPTTPFLYDPTKGALLLDVNITSSPTTPVGFEENNDATTARVFNIGGTGAPLASTSPAQSGLVTQFNVTPGAVPEPTSLVLCGVGLAGIWGARRASMRRR